MSCTRVKFCGMSREEDIDAAVSLGVHALGFIFAPSPRQLQLADARRLIRRVPPFVTTVAVFVDPDDAQYHAVKDLMPNMLPQFCGSETPERCAELAGGASYLKVFHIHAASDATSLIQEISAYPNSLPVFDTHMQGRGGGSGVAFDWNILPPPSLHGIVAGGLTAENVASCIERTRPYAVDVRSGIEIDGQKSYDRMAAFIAAVRKTDKE